MARCYRGQRTGITEKQREKEKKKRENWPASREILERAKRQLEWYLYGHSTQRMNPRIRN